MRSSLETCSHMLWLMSSWGKGLTNSSVWRVFFEIQTATWSVGSRSNWRFGSWLHSDGFESYHIDSCVYCFSWTSTQIFRLSTNSRSDEYLESSTLLCTYLDRFITSGRQTAVMSSGWGWRRGPPGAHDTSWMIITNINVESICYVTMKNRNSSNVESTCCVAIKNIDAAAPSSKKRRIRLAAH